MQNEIACWHLSAPTRQASRIENLSEKKIFKAKWYQDLGQKYLEDYYSSTLDQRLVPFSNIIISLKEFNVKSR